MRNTTLAAVSAAAAAVAALSGGAAQASTPDWLTVVSVESEHDSMLPAVCEADELGQLTSVPCATLLGSPSEDAVEATGEPLPEAPGDFGGMPSLVNLDARNFAKWQVCGISVASASEAAECDNSIQPPAEPVGPGSGISLVNADVTGAFQWSVCGIAVAQAGTATTC
ncbi:hypothetical protein AB0B28_04100 [Glycomyces sp. NPDC046736]|uniref:hypothetical protein n=1 Tax=Glycomyces sp. NPDC046736 TaxID=3155615 RepID=UPI0033FAEA6A